MEGESAKEDNFPIELHLDTTLQKGSTVTHNTLPGRSFTIVRVKVEIHDKQHWANKLTYMLFEDKLIADEKIEDMSVYKGKYL